MSDTPSQNATRTDQPGNQSAHDAAAAASQVSPWTLKEKIGRALWMIVRGVVFKHTWHNWYEIRNGLLRLFGAKIGRSVKIRPSARIEVPWNLAMGDYSSIGDFGIVYNLGPITVGRRVTISQYAHLCAGTHDYTRADMPLIRPRITIEDDAWIAAQAFVGPEVTVGRGAILGACGVAMKSLEPMTIYAGNPAKAVKPRPPLGIPGG